MEALNKKFSRNFFHEAHRERRREVPDNYSPIALAG